jgi:hypothetical protein
MTWIGDSKQLVEFWKWARGSWWKTIVAIVVILGSVTVALILLILYLLGYFYKPEDRWTILSGWLKKLWSCLIWEQNGLMQTW